MEESQRVGFETVLSLTRLSASTQRCIRLYWLLNAVERLMACEAGGELSCDKRREIFEVLYMLSRASKPCSRWKANHIARSAYPSIGTVPDPVHTQRQSNKSECVPVRSRMRNVASIL